MKDHERSESKLRLLIAMARDFSASSKRSHESPTYLDTLRPASKPTSERSRMGSSCTRCVTSRLFDHGVPRLTATIAIFLPGCFVMGVLPPKRTGAPLRLGGRFANTSLHFKESEMNPWQAKPTERRTDNARREAFEQRDRSKRVCDAPRESKAIQKLAPTVPASRLF